MRKLLFLVLFLWLSSSEIGSTGNVLRVETLIRRAFLDVTGLVPTAEEIDWFCVYSENSYPTAVEYLSNKSHKIWDVDADACKHTLLSLEYMNQPFRPIDIKPSIVFVVGLFEGFDHVTPKLVQDSKESLIQNALKEYSRPGDVIDYMCIALMSRAANVYESNLLEDLFKLNKQLGEVAAYMVVLEHILTLHDVRNK